MEKKKKSFIKRYWMLIVAALAAIFVMLNNPAQGEVLSNAIGHYFFEMLSFIPPVFLLTALLDVWVPRRIVEGNIGPKSGLKGIFITIITAASAAGPLYVAFPIVLTLYKKGAKLSNVILFINTWATIKIPMVLNEMRFVGTEFAITRLILTIPVIIIISLIVERISKGSIVDLNDQPQALGGE